MENATKALLIAAGVLFVLMIISLLVMGYEGISSYYEQRNEILTAEQLDKFNKQFQNYHRENIRGNEMISLMNKIIDYNVSQSYQEGTGYDRIAVEIIIDESGDNSIVNQFKFELDGNKYGDNDLIKKRITNTTGANYASDQQLITITTLPTKLKGLGIELTDNQLQKLEVETANIIVLESDGNEDKGDSYRAIENRRYRAVILKNILNLKETKIDKGPTLPPNIKLESKTEPSYSITLDGKTYKTLEDDQGIIETIKDITSQYYQYVRFKRAKFECTDIIHNTDTGRVKGMKFKLQVNDKGFVDFD